MFDGALIGWVHYDTRLFNCSRTCYFDIRTKHPFAKKTIGDSAPNNVLFAREHKFQQSSNQTDDNIVVNKVVT